MHQACAAQRYRMCQRSAHCRGVQCQMTRHGCDRDESACDRARALRSRVLTASLQFPRCIVVCSRVLWAHRCGERGGAGLCATLLAPLRCCTPAVSVCSCLAPIRVRAGPAPCSLALRRTPTRHDARGRRTRSTTRSHSPHCKATGSSNSSSCVSEPAMRSESRERTTTRRHQPCTRMHTAQRTALLHRILARRIQRPSHSHRRRCRSS